MLEIPGSLTIRKEAKLTWIVLQREKHSKTGTFKLADEEIGEQDGNQKCMYNRDWYRLGEI